MKYRLLGNTGLFVSELCLGTMTFGGGGMWNIVGQLGEGDVDTMVNRSLDAGINFIDTANVYAAGLSEVLVGKALGARRKDVILATKVQSRMGNGANDVGLSRVHIMNEIHASLKRLNTDYIDLYQIHGYDGLTDMEDVLRTLDDLVRSGKVRYIGCSNLAAWRLMKFLGIAKYNKLEPFVSLQSHYSIVTRDLERDIVPLLLDQNLGLMVWSPLAGGFLGGKISRESEKSDGTRRAFFEFPPVDKTRGFNVIDTLREIADIRGASVPQIALAWLLHQPAVTTVIIGAKTIDQFEDNIKAADIALEKGELEKLNTVSQLPPEYPGWMFEFGKRTARRRPEEVAR